MDIESLKAFIKELERLSKVSNNSALDSIVFWANHFIQHGEAEVALEITLDNLYEDAIFLDDEIINLARKAYGTKITLEREKDLNMLQPPSNDSEKHA